MGRITHQDSLEDVPEINSNNQDVRKFYSIFRIFFCWEKSLNKNFNVNFPILSYNF